jgi:energy-coupling factor transporter ATP-binding protein EcfA2
MARFEIQKATRQKIKARIGLFGPAGSGKTRTALEIATVIAGPDGRVCVVDAENRSSERFAGDPSVPGQFDFDVLHLTDYSPTTYVEALAFVEEQGYAVTVLDGISQAWAGKGGVLEQVDKITARSKSRNKFTSGWREMTPKHNAFVDALVHCSTHLIVTCRSKMEYVLMEDDRGRKVPTKVGMAPVQRDGLEYEFDIVGDLDLDHNLAISKARGFDALDGAVIEKPGVEFAQQVLLWLQTGADSAPDPIAKGGKLSFDEAKEKAAALAAELGSDHPSLDEARTLLKAGKYNEAIDLLEAATGRAEPDMKGE